ncbi:MAG: hypothetical protein ACM30E_05910 [Nitrososphaerales archaeon]
MSRRAVLLLIFGLVLIGVFSAVVAYAQEGPPPLPQAFWGSVEVNGQPAPVGAKVEARGDNVLVDVPGNPITVTVAGKYGGQPPTELKLSVQGQLQEDQPLEFYVDGAKAEVQKVLTTGEVLSWQDSTLFVSGVSTNLNLRVGSTQVQTSPTPTVAATFTMGPTPTLGAAVNPSATPQASTTNATDTPQPTATRSANTATTPVSTATNGPSGSTQPVKATSQPGAVVSKPTGAATAAPLAASPVPPTETVQATSTPAATETPTIEPTRVEPTATAAKVAAVPNATVKPILNQAKPPEAVQSTLAQTSGSSGRSVALWAGLGLVLVAIALGVLLKVRGLPR